MDLKLEVVVVPVADVDRAKAFYTWRRPMITYDRLDIGGSWTEPSDPTLLEIASPHDRSLIGQAA